MNKSIKIPLYPPFLKEDTLFLSLLKRGKVDFLCFVKKLPIRVLVISVFILFTLSCVALSEQKSSELAFISSHNPIQKTSESKINLSGVSGLKNLPVIMIRFYQLYISTQDKPVCNFTPSCSQFGVESIREFGIIRGIILTSDRLQRCNGMSTSRYQLDYESGRLIDPVQLYVDIQKK